MVAVFADGQYDHSSTWANANDRVEWERSFATGSAATRKMASAMISANPVTPAEEIRAVMTAPPMPPPAGMKVSPTLDDVLSTGPMGYTPPGSHLYDSAPTDFTGTQGAREGSSIPSLSAY